jgi:hypothetical protein
MDSYPPAGHKPYQDEVVYAGIEYSVRLYTHEGKPFTMFYEPPSDRGWINDLVIAVWPKHLSEEMVEWLLSNNRTGSRGGPKSKIKKPV